ncbi:MULTISPECIES: hypothetical protein [Rhizobium]|uniref:hypothetical protein n=1 Tax=Rhizobium TaxID=379 RepID=UPI001C9282B7|nr:hypothetical protein [Rhizobium laguerreae]MBY3364971.1 hypothetical protein [Rhizobium laguerreae]MBY3384175.1 hypothetical protein [Rhizobium laguerreae]MBY3397836.1 hypothetical protein [Rhizobium laguerreae]MBY3404776.1 hypothetical protein [Rhizobium laguerreae]MBY3510664.1 hypothetical protein [Rhizobium laguerreae]
MLAISRTIPFRKFQSAIGHSTYRLNTIVVGLELVALGHDKPKELNIKWRKPAEGQPARSVANQAKTFALLSAMVYGTDLFDTFLRDFGAEDWLGFKQQTIFISGKHGSGQGARDFSIRERAKAIVDDLGPKSIEQADVELVLPTMLALLDLMAKWRNNIVHGSHGKDRQIDEETRKQLLTAAEYLKEKYSNVEISRTLKSFDQGAHPTRKDVTVLLASLQNLSRLLDVAAIRRVAPDVSAVEAIADQLLCGRWKPTESNRRGWAEFCEIWSRKPTDRSNGITKALAQLAITATSEPVSPHLSEGYVNELASLAREDVARRLGL